MMIRFATPADAAAILDIYGPYVTNSTITFEYEVPTVTEIARRIQTIQLQFPYLVFEVNGCVLGYAYASRHRDRTAYQWSVETSVYVHPDGHRQGIARQLYTALLDFLRRQGYYNAYAGITLPNPQSEVFHRSMGFEPLGVFANIGFKLGSWCSVGWFQLAIQPHQSDPAVPVSITAIR